MTYLGHLSKNKQINQKYIELLYAIRKNEGVECEQLPDIFFPEDATGYMQREEIKLAKQICSDCPIKNACADYALTAEEPYGIWGGMTPVERHNLMRLKTKLQEEQD